MFDINPYITPNYAYVPIILEDEYPVDRVL